MKSDGDGTKTLKQSIMIRQSSLFTCIESVYSNYDAIVLALESRRCTKYTRGQKSSPQSHLVIFTQPYFA